MICQNQLLNELTAKYTGRTVVAGPVEATSIGNVLCQGIACGAIKDLAEGRKIVKNSFDIAEYTPCDSDAWDKAYEEWKKVISK